MRLAEIINGSLIAYFPAFAKQFTPKGAIIIGWVLGRRGTDHEVEATIEQACQETGMGRKAFLNARRKIGEVLKIRTEHREHRTFYSIDNDKLQKILGGSK